MSEKTSVLTYAQAIEELEAILSKLRADNCDVDTLAERTRRAAELLNFCRAKLTATDEELSNILDDLDKAVGS